MSKLIQSLPEEARPATFDDFFNNVGERILIRSAVEYYEDIVLGYAQRLTSTDTNGEKLLRLIKSNRIFIIPK